MLLDGKSIRKQKDYQRYAIMGRVYQNPSLGTSPNLTMLENLSLADNKGKSFGLGFWGEQKAHRLLPLSWPPWAWGWRINWT